MFKTIKSLFIIEDEAATRSSSNAKQEEKSSPTNEKPPSAAIKREDSKPATTVSPAATVSPEGKVTSKFMDILFGAMEKNNIDGFDYLEFKKSLQSLAKMPMDEQTRFQSAFAMAQSMGVTPQSLVDTANHYLKVLQQEEQKFEQALAKQKNHQIGNKEQQIKQLESVIQQKAAQIKKLTTEIEQHQKQSTNLKNEIANKAIKIENTKNNFIASYDALVAQIQQDINNMKNYLK